MVLVIKSIISKIINLYICYIECYNLDTATKIYSISHIKKYLGIENSTILKKN